MSWLLRFGLLLLTLAHLKQASLYFRERGLVRCRVVLESGRTKVVDGQDTLRIEQYSPAEKLLLAQQGGVARPTAYVAVSVREQLYTNGPLLN